MRALYDPFLHGSRRHIGSEVWVSFTLGPLDRYPYHNSHLISDLLRFGVLGVIITYCYICIPTCFSIFFYIYSSFVLSLFNFFYSHCSSSHFMNDDFFGVHHPLLDIVHVDIGLGDLAHTILLYLTLHTYGFGIIYWVFGPSLRSQS